MRKLACFIAVLLIGCGSFAGELTVPEIAQDTAVATNGAAITTNATAVAVNGYVSAVILDLSGYASPTVDVDVVTEGISTPSLTILSVDSVAADTVWFPRGVPEKTDGTDISNDSAKIPVVGEKIQAWVSNANSTGIVAKVDVVIEIQR